MASRFSSFHALLRAISRYKDRLAIDERAFKYFQ